MTTLTDPEKITLPEIEKLKAEIMLLKRQFHEEVVRAFIAGTKFILDKR